MSEFHKIVENLYDLLSKDGNLNSFINDINFFGIQCNDPRIENIVRASSVKRDFSGMDIDTFKSAVAPYEGLLIKYSRRDFIIPDFESFTNVVRHIFDKCKSNKGGANAAYIPQLAEVSDYWGVSICTVDGQRFSIGDTKVPFTIQSCSKPLSYAIALECLTEDVVHKYVGAEPSGRIFNEMALDHNNKPHNPMINSGAIVTASLIHTLVEQKLSVAQKFNFVKSWLQKAAGNERLGFDNSVYLSEREVADRNFALGYFMKEKKAFPPNANMLESLDFYFQLCSIEATANELGTISATLANGGVCPLTDQKIFSPTTVRNVLSLMHSCGLYDYSGEFAFKVGLPSKSGVAGAVMIIVPNMLGICCFSPKLDPLGNSVRGIQFCEEITKYYAIHPYDNIRQSGKSLMGSAH